MKRRDLERNLRVAGCYLPGRGIDCVAYVTADAGTVRAELGSYFDSLLKAGVRVMHVIADDTGRLSAPEPLACAACLYAGDKRKNMQCAT